MTALYQLFCQIPAFNWQQLDLESIMSSFRAQWELFQAQVLGLGTQSGQKNVILEIKLQMPIYYVSHWTKFLCCSFLLTRKNNCFSGWSLAGLGCDLWQSLASCHRLWRTRGGGDNIGQVSRALLHLFWIQFIKELREHFYCKTEGSLEIFVKVFFMQIILWAYHSSWI